MQERSQQTRERLLDAALTLFAEKGFERTSVREIVERAHVAKGTFYVHFETKLEVLRGLTERIMILFRDAFSTLNHHPPEICDIELLLRRMADLMSRNAMLTEMLHRFDHMGALMLDSTKLMELFIVEPVSMWMERAISSGVIKAVPVKRYARIMTKMSHDLLECAFLCGYPASLEDTIEDLSAMIHLMLKPVPNPSEQD